MKEGWKYIAFEKCLQKVPKQVQVKSKDYLKSGRYPIVSQEADLISGYWNDNSIVYHHEKPIVIFGDHTKNVKYIDFDFVVGADGTHILLPKADIDTKFFYYAIKSLKLRNLGYARHYKLLKEKQIPVPSMEEQQRIVDYLDSAFAKIDALKAKAKESLDNAQALFQAALKEAMKPKEGWEKKMLGEITEKMADGPFGSNLKAEHYTTKREVRIIQLSNISENGWREDNTKYTTFEHLKTISRSEVEPGDIVIAKMMPAGRAIICPSHEQKFVLSSDAVKVKLKPGLYNLFVCYYINSYHYRKQVLDNVTGAGRVRTSLTKLRDYVLYIPPISEQYEVASKILSCYEILDKLHKNFISISSECDAMKQAILRQAFE